MSATPAPPLVTLGLLTHRRERYVREAVRSVLAQTYSPLQIVICDDASPDSTVDILNEEVNAYRGPHRIVFHRNPSNLGLGNYNQLMSLAEGAFVVIAHDDDISRPERVERMVRAWRETGASLVSSNGIQIAGDGREIGPAVLPGTPKTIAAEDLARDGWNQWLFGGALAWDRKVFDVWGPLDTTRTAFSTDWIIPFRAALMGTIAIVDEPLIAIRRHGETKTVKMLWDDTDNFGNQEGNLANGLTQFYYMLETVTDEKAKDFLSPAALEKLRRRLLMSILETLHSWRFARTALLAQGKRPRWQPID